MARSNNSYICYSKNIQYSPSTLPIIVFGNVHNIMKGSKIICLFHSSCLNPKQEMLDCWNQILQVYGRQASLVTPSRYSSSKSGVHTPDVSQLFNKIFNPQGLVVLYLGVVIFMVRRQMRMIGEEEMEDEKVMMINKEGKTDICRVEAVLGNTSEVLM